MASKSMEEFYDVGSFEFLTDENVMPMMKKGQKRSTFLFDGTLKPVPEELIKKGYVTLLSDGGLKFDSRNKEGVTKTYYPKDDYPKKGEKGIFISYEFDENKENPAEGERCNNWQKENGHSTLQWNEKEQAWYDKDELDGMGCFLKRGYLPKFLIKSDIYRIIPFGPEGKIGLRKIGEKEIKWVDPDHSILYWHRNFDKQGKEISPSITPIDLRTESADRYFYPTDDMSGNKVWICVNSQYKTKYRAMTTTKVVNIEELIGQEQTREDLMKMMDLLQTEIDKREKSEKNPQASHEDR